MHGAFGSKRARRKPVINITSLIDVMFLLIIFFTVSSTFRQDLGIDITLPSAASSTSQQMSPHEVSVGADGTVIFANEQVSTGQLKTVLQELLQREPDAMIVLKADDAAPFQDVVNVIDVARQVGGQRLIVPTRTPEIAQ